jgi:hypothetical protein
MEGTIVQCFWLQVHAVVPSARGIRRDGAGGQPERFACDQPAPQPDEDTLNRLLRPSKLAPLEPRIIGPAVEASGDQADSRRITPVIARSRLK